MRKIAVILMLAFLPMLLTAQEIEGEKEKSKPQGPSSGITSLPGIMATDNATMISVGNASQLDTYLSPEHYSGVELRYMDEHVRWHNYPACYYTFNTQVFVSRTSPRSDNASELSGMVEFRFGYHRLCSVNHNLYCSLGAQAEAFIGGTYNTRNGNNPAQLRAGMDIAPTASASYIFSMFRKSFLLRYTVSVPLVGIQFSPAYGQSYYEIFSEGSYNHNICFTSPLNAASMSNRLTLDIPLKHGRTALRIGYLGEFRQARLNDIKFHNFTHGFIIGYVY